MFGLFCRCYKVSVEKETCVSLCLRVLLGSTYLPTLIITILVLTHSIERIVLEY